MAITTNTNTTITIISTSHAQTQQTQQPQLQPEDSQQASPVDITIILSVSLLFIAFFILWVRAYYAEVSRRKNQQQIRRLQERERMRQRLHSFMIMREEEYWKSLMNEECLPMYEEEYQLAGTEEYEMREFDGNDHMHIHDIDIAIRQNGDAIDHECTRQDVDAVECTRQDGDAVECTRQDGDQTERISIREPPPVYMSLGRL